MGAKAWLAATVACATDSIITMRLSGLVVTWNAAATRLLGYEALEMIGHSSLRVVPPELRAEESAILSRLARGERISHYESVRLRKDGARVDVSVAIAPIRDTGGIIVGASEVVRDITERRREQRQLFEHADLVDLARDAIIVRDAEDRITFWNRGAERVYGWTRGEALGRVSHDLLQTRFREPLEEVRTTLLEKSFWEGMLVNRHRDGSEVVTLSRWTVRRAQGGQLLEVVEANSDITLEHHLVDQLRTQAKELAQQTLEEERAAADLSQMNVELEHAVQDAERANQAKNEFLALMSHELRTPLNVIAGHAQLLEEGIHGPVTDKQRDAISRIQAAEKRLLSLVNDVLTFAKLRTEDGHAELKDVILEDALAEVETRMTPQLRSKELRYSRTFCSRDRRVRADRNSLMRIMEHLLSNAIRFTPNGGAVRIECAEHPDTGTIDVAVHDSGIGIPGDKLEEIFTPFSQVNRGLTRTEDGAGLSLALSRQLARRMGGELSVESEQGKGSTFTLRLEAAPDSKHRASSAAGVTETADADAA